MSDLKSLGYITASTSDIERWRHFAFGVLGFAEGQGPDPSALYLRMDERAARIIVVPGETDRVLTIGWEVRDHAALQRVTAALDRAAVAFKRLSVDEAGDRRVEEVISFEDPSGTTLEVFHGAVLDHSPVITPFARNSSPAIRALATSWCRLPIPTRCSTSTPTYWVSCPEARSGCRTERIRAGSGAVPRYQRAPPQHGDRPGRTPA